jgi:hypothetical protein
MRIPIYLWGLGVLSVIWVLSSRSALSTLDILLSATCLTPSIQNEHVEHAQVSEALSRRYLAFTLILPGPSRAREKERRRLGTKLRKKSVERDLHLLLYPKSNRGMEPHLNLGSQVLFQESLGAMLQISW